MIRTVKFMLVVREMDRALAFYRDAFGLHVRSHTALWSELAHGDAVIGLHPGAGEGFRPTGLSFEVEDIDAACRSAVRHGASLRSGPTHRPGEPIRLAELSDPEGNGFYLTAALI